jgi:hypothetical protein
MLLALQLTSALSDCPRVYTSSLRFDSFLFPWSDCVLIRECIFTDLASLPVGLGGAISIIAPIADVRVTEATFIECRAFGDFASAGSGGACYLDTTTTAITFVCASNCSAGSRAHFTDLVAAHAEARHSVDASTVLSAGSHRSLHATDATFAVEGGSETSFSGLNFTNCRVSGEGAVCGCEPGDRRITFTNIVAVANAGQSLLHVNERPNKPQLAHSVICDNAVSRAVLTGVHYGIDVETTIFSGNGDKICSLTNPSNLFSFSACVFSGPFPTTCAYAQAPNLLFTRTATYAISGRNTWPCVVTPLASPSRLASRSAASSRRRSATPRAQDWPPSTATARAPGTVGATPNRSTAASSARSPSPTAHGLQTTAPFTPSEWPPVHSSGSNGDAGVIGLYCGIIGGSAIAGIAAGVIVFLVWQKRGAKPGLDPRGLSTDFTGMDGAYVDSQWRRDPLQEFARQHPQAGAEVPSMSTFRGEDIDELL